MFRSMTRNQAGFLYAAAFILAAIMMGGVHWLLTGINADFGMGVAVGIALGMGIIGLASRRVRESD